MYNRVLLGAQYSQICIKTISLVYLQKAVTLSTKENFYWQHTKGGWFLLLPTSKIGRQKCLNDLMCYCYKWGLRVNSSKTKCMILTKHTYRSDKFEFYNTISESVRWFNSLGFQLSYNSKIQRIIDDRMSKAEKTRNIVYKRLRQILMYPWSCHYLISEIVIIRWTKLPHTDVWECNMVIAQPIRIRYIPNKPNRKPKT